LSTAQGKDAPIVLIECHRKESWYNHSYTVWAFHWDWDWNWQRCWYLFESRCQKQTEIGDWNVSSTIEKWCVVSWIFNWNRSVESEVFKESEIQAVG
jgi:hypothetical protein